MLESVLPIGVLIIVIIYVLYIFYTETETQLNIKKKIVNYIYSHFEGEKNGSD